MLHLTERVFHLLLQDSELPVKVDAAMGLQFLVKFQELCECDGRGGKVWENAVGGLVGVSVSVRGGECGFGGVRCVGGGRERWVGGVKSVVTM